MAMALAMRRARSTTMAISQARPSATPASARVTATTPAMITTTPPAPAAASWAIAFALTALFMVVEFAGGVLAKSLALVADAGHMLTDAAALALAWAAVRIATRPADAKRSFGYQRLRVLATFVNGCALLFIVAWIAFEAVQRLLNPVPVNATAILWIGTHRPRRQPASCSRCCAGATRTT